ncbi:Uncharacterised protein [Mycobacteroides abscessus]|nr:Uncharacterised protein [Mycobacteroides abscessus]
MANNTDSSSSGGSLPSRSATAAARALAASSTSAHIERYSSTTDTEPTIIKLANTTAAATSAERVAIPPPQPRTLPHSALMSTRPFFTACPRCASPAPDTAPRVVTTSRNHRRPTTDLTSSAQEQAQPRRMPEPGYARHRGVPAHPCLTCPRHRPDTPSPQHLAARARRCRHHCHGSHADAIGTRYARDHLGHSHHQTRYPPRPRLQTSTPAALGIAPTRPLRSILLPALVDVVIVVMGVTLMRSGLAMPAIISTIFITKLATRPDPGSKRQPQHRHDGPRSARNCCRTDEQRPTGSSSLRAQFSGLHVHVFGWFVSLVRFINVRHTLTMPIRR